MEGHCKGYPVSTPLHCQSHEHQRNLRPEETEKRLQLNMVKHPALDPGTERDHYGKTDEIKTKS